MHKPIFIIFTARRYAIAVYAVVVCVRLCLTSRCSIKTAKSRTTQTTLYDSLRTLVNWCQRSPRNSNGVTFNEGTINRWGRLKSAIFDRYLPAFQKRCKIET